MKVEDIDLMLSRDDKIVPSSGFTAAVMDAIAREATTPPPLPFPWKRALPGLGWCLAVSIVFLTMVPGASDNSHPAHPALDFSKVLGGVGWTTAALVVSLLSVALSIRMARRV